MMGIISNLGAIDGIVGVDIPREEQRSVRNSDSLDSASRLWSEAKQLTMKPLTNTSSQTYVL